MALACAGRIQAHANHEWTCAGRKGARGDSCRRLKMRARASSDEGDFGGGR